MMRAEIEKDRRRVAELTEEQDKYARAMAELERQPLSESDLADFQRYCTEHDVRASERAAALVAWMDQRAGDHGPGEPHRR